MIARLLVLIVVVLAPRAALAQRHSPTRTPLDSATYAADVLAAARRDYIPIRFCYDATPRAVLDRIQSLSLVVGADGAVQSVEIAPSSAQIRRFRECLSPIVRTWHLTPPMLHLTGVVTFAFAELRRGVDEARR